MRWFWRETGNRVVSLVLVEFSLVLVEFFVEGLLYKILIEGNNMNAPKNNNFCCNNLEWNILFYCLFYSHISPEFTV